MGNPKKVFIYEIPEIQNTLRFYIEPFLLRLAQKIKTLPPNNIATKWQMSFGIIDIGRDASSCKIKLKVNLSILISKSFC